MTLRDIMEKAATLVGVSVNFSAVGDEQTRFVNAGKDVVSRICTEFYDVKRTERATAANGVIPFSALSRAVKRVLRVRKDGIAASFCERPDGIEVGEDGTYDVLYAYFSDAPNYFDPVDLPPRFACYVLALGTASEYCYGKGFYEEGKHYDERFVAAVNNVIAGGKRVTVRAVRDE